MPYSITHRPTTTEKHYIVKMASTVEKHDAEAVSISPIKKLIRARSSISQIGLGGDQQSQKDSSQKYLRIPQPASSHRNQDKDKKVSPYRLIDKSLLALNDYDRQRPSTNQTTMYHRKNYRLFGAYQ